MLVLTLGNNQRVTIGNAIVEVEQYGHQTRIFITAPPEVPILRADAKVRFSKSQKS
ncbi:carbon storage regulator CsrA [Sinobacterium caligoides]|uniref:Carbon storage regulator CsrA n=1 Tax=Sinobacterium caligoides TaxID=933926 RepID=A0A3N2DJF2_9GAMM|nr:carbon storage regulator CsrA [Sinobacterium caligoides]